MSKLKHLKKAVAAFNRQVSEGHYATEPCSCLCGANHFWRICRHDSGGMWAPTVLCCECGLIYTEPRLTREAVRQFYNSGDFKSTCSVFEYIEGGTRADGQGSEIFAVMQPLMVSRDLHSVFEVGCSTGYNLPRFAAVGHRVSGCDLTPALVERGRRQGLEIYEGSEENIRGTHDVIILSHVMEHFADFFSSMQAVCRHLSPQGLLFIAVPNMDNFYAGQIQTGHHYYFSPRTLTRYVEQCGLRQIASGVSEKQHMYGVFERGAGSAVAGSSGEARRMRRTVRRGLWLSRLSRLLDYVGLRQRMERWYWQRGKQNS